ALVRQRWRRNSDISEALVCASREREWRLCHSSDAIAAREFGHRHAIGNRLTIMAAVSRIGQEQIEMEVVGVEGVAAWPEHGIELGAGAGKRGLEEGPLGGPAIPPVVHDADLASICKAKGSDIECVAERMLRQLDPKIVARPAAIGGDLANPYHAAAEIVCRGGLHRAQPP